MTDTNDLIYVCTYYGPKDAPFSLWKDKSRVFYYWRTKGDTKPKPLRGSFTDKKKAVDALILHLKSHDKPYCQAVKKKFGGHPWEDTWKLPPPVKASRYNGLKQAE